MSAWLELKTELARSDVDLAEELLLAIGAVSITNLDAQDQPLLEPGPGETPLWDRVIVVGLFTGDRDPDALRGEFAQSWQLALDTPVPAFRVEELADQPWERVWLEHFKPMRFGERLWVVPSWTDAPVADAVNLRLDPGLAFGTGTHQTTALCLRFLDGLATAGALRDARVLDFGCGSGILGIAAKLLGAREVTGVDNDPQAIIATRENAERNSVVVSALLPREFEFLAGSAGASFDVVVANILAGPLVTLAPQIAARLRHDGHLALSGILRDQADDVMAAYLSWVDWDAPVIDGDWVRLTGRRKRV